MENEQLINDKVAVFLTGVLQKMGVEADIEKEENETGIYYRINGRDAARLIGYRGEALDALQSMATLIEYDNKEDGKRIYVDAEGYRDKRKGILTSLAERLAYKAYKTKRRQALEPMNPYERRIIHFALQNSDYAETVSEGEGRERHIVIVPKNIEATDDRAPEIQYGRSEFSQKGFGKTRSFGGKKRRF